MTHFVFKKFLHVWWNSSLQKVFIMCAMTFTTKTVAYYSRVLTTEDEFVCNLSMTAPIVTDFWLICSRKSFLMAAIWNSVQFFCFSMPPSAPAGIASSIIVVKAPHSGNLLIKVETILKDHFNFSPSYLYPQFKKYESFHIFPSTSFPQPGILRTHNGLLSRVRFPVKPIRLFIQLRGSFPLSYLYP